MPLMSSSRTTTWRDAGAARATPTQPASACRNWPHSVPELVVTWTRAADGALGVAPGLVAAAVAVPPPLGSHADVVARARRATVTKVAPIPRRRRRDVRLTS